MTLTGKRLSIVASCTAIFGATVVSAAYHEGGEAMANPTISIHLTTGSRSTAPVWSSPSSRRQMV
jgi:hypothetical protein